MRKLFSALAVLVLTGAGCADGDHDTATSDHSTGDAIEVTMVDSKFQPAELTVRKGEEVTFRFSNEGVMAHEALIGDSKTQDDHEEEMQSASTMGDMGDMGGMHHGGDTDVVKVEPGKSAELTTTFDEAGTFLIGCHQPGHYAAGMKATVTVTE